MPPSTFVRRLFLTAALLTTACSTDPYPVDTQRQPPWKLAGVDSQPTAEPYRVGTLQQPPWNRRSRDELRAADPRFKSGSTDPYAIDSLRQSRWREAGAAPLLPVEPVPSADPSPGTEAQRFAFCYARPLNDDEEVWALAEERCVDGLLVVESRDGFWNGCSLLQPMRVTYVCHLDPSSPGSE